MENDIITALQGKAKELMALRGTSQHNAESEKLSLLLFQAANLIAQQATDNQVWSAGYVRREFELDAERRLKEKALEKYATAARVIALYLYEFCDRSKPYDEMVADAVRRAAARLEQLKQERDTLYVDFVDYVCSGTSNLAPYCSNKSDACIDSRGWCKTGCEACRGFRPGSVQLNGASPKEIPEKE